MKNRYEVRGDVTVMFVNYKGNLLEALIDTEDLERAMSFPGTWYADFSKNTNTHYVRGKHGGAYRLHRWLMGNPNGFQIDHVNQNTLDNRRSCNLRKATNGQNMQNRSKSFKNSRTGIRGVCWHQASNKWTAQIQVNKKNKCLGFYSNIGEAIRAVKEARAEMMPFSKEARLKERKNNGC